MEFSLKPDVPTNAQIQRHGLGFTALICGLGTFFGPAFGNSLLDAMSDSLGAALTGFVLWMIYWRVRGQNEVEALSIMAMPTIFFPNVPTSFVPAVAVVLFFGVPIT